MIKRRQTKDSQPLSEVRTSKKNERMVEMKLTATDEVKKLLGAETVKAIEAITGDDELFIGQGQFVTKGRFDQINGDLTEAKNQNATLAKGIEDAKKNSVTKEDYDKKIAELTQANEQAQKEYQAKIAANDKNYKIDEALRGVKARNLKAVKSLIDIEKITVDGEKLIGFDEQIKPIIEKEKYLFEEVKPGRAGSLPGGGNDGTPLPTPKTF